MRYEAYYGLQMILEGKVDGKKGKGSKRGPWMRCIKKWTRKDWGTLIHTTHNRKDVAVIVANLAREGTQEEDKIFVENGFSLSKDHVNSKLVIH